MSSETLCLNCKCGSVSCPWMRARKPVPGWKVERTCVRNQHRTYATYRVISCPNYVQDERAVVKTAKRKYLPWTKEDTLTLLQLLGRVTYKEIADKLDRDVDSINSAVERLRRKGII